MPSAKPKIQVVMEPFYYEKFAEICKKEDRSMSKMAARIITEWLKKYEQDTQGGGICN